MRWRPCSVPELMAPGAWEAYVRRWSRQVPPLRPHADSVGATARLLQAQRGTTLLLGATPELAALDRQIIAVDWAQSAISDIWPGDTANRHAVLGDQRALPISSRSVGSVMGDGSLNAVRWPKGARNLIDEIDRVLTEHGITVLRAFVASESREAVDAICSDVRNGRESSFAATKWRSAMSLADIDGNCAAADVYDLFERAFPDRIELSQWFAPEVLLAGQFRQLAQLVDHAARHSPQFARRLRDAGLSAADTATPQGLGALPPLTRAMLQGDPATIDCAVHPPEHLPVRRNVSSGSTGEPVSVRRTAVNAVFWGAQTLRWQFWSHPPVGGRLAVVRAGVP